jgi:hypothetical protein
MATKRVPRNNCGLTKRQKMVLLAAARWPKGIIPNNRSVGAQGVYRSLVMLGLLRYGKGNFLLLTEEGREVIRKYAAAENHRPAR